ncbi:prolipoprotein diacylglyceryl transferase [Blastopirellula sp. JC732]|uniref:Prolipoprotein diacylglyceryl transferase n=1 Tax=Blastopirellula sediminis TaxID=2894196 RepID=A0A9X1SI94_9BACT|nr:prolipoprotein diacylglyceryl transferase family protein [Blastopirellula sediminis]MCC9604667.1 prolipoprotein diacylglyceryl transferase [Blastopirellula sediminis]MCC9632035.1 prolipoprotein diacylglyceryl transferase [Blastopirellula sediminis]
MMINPTYIVIMATAIALCSLMVRRSQQKLPLTREEKFGLGLGGFCGAMIGAKLPFVLYDLEGLWSGGAWFAHGKTIVCGLAGGYLGVEIAKWLMNVRIKTGDSFAAPVAFAIAIGRWGCFFGGCCFGTPTTLPWGVAFPTAVDDPLALRHPTQIYESLFHLTMGFTLLWLQRKGWFRGQLMKLYILVYLGYRFLTEMIRPEPRYFVGLTAYQWGAIALAIIFIWLWRRDAAALSAESAQKEPRPADAAAD